MPKDRNNQQSWFRDHGSAAFVGALVVLGLASLWGATWLQGKALHPTFANLLLQLSGSLLAGGVAGIFLSFNDVKNHIAKVVSTFLADGSMLALLSSESREALTHQLLMRKLGAHIDSIEPSLLSHLRHVSDQCLSMIHLHNYKASETILTHPTRGELLAGETTITFRAKAFHLRGQKADFTYRYVHEIAIPSVQELQESEFLLHFEGRFGDRILSEKDVQVSKRIENGMPYMSLKLELSVQINGEMDCSFRLRSALQKVDNLCATLARYPTCGYQFQLIYDQAHEYDCILFKGRDPNYGSFPGSGDVHRNIHGISVITNDWVLPGEGAMITWLPRQVETGAEQDEPQQPPLAALLSTSPVA